MEEPQNPECAVMASMNLPNKARETTLLPSNEQFGGDTEGAGGDTEGAGGDTEGAGGDTEGAGGDTEGAGGDTEGAGGGGDERTGIITLIYLFILPPVYLLYHWCRYRVLVL